MISIISLDVGDKRVGVAIGTRCPDSFAPYATFNRAKGEAEKKIINLVNERNVSQLIAGLPLSEDGTFNEQCAKIEKFCQRIQKRCNVKVVFVDEYATTEEAKEAVAGLRGFSVIKKSREKNLDAVAASLILQSYIEKRALEIKR